MCGVVGFIGTPSKVNRQIFQDMLMLDARRGPHSTGVAAASKKTAYTLKSTQLPWDLANEKDFKAEIMGKNWPVMMGHNRFATLGAVKNDNAHPFWHDHIIMTHNGTLTGLYRLEKWIDFDTDSECFTYNVAKQGIAKVYEETGGAMTCVWWDQKTARLNVITNGQRPFCFTYSQDQKTMFYSSEDWMFRLACEARGVQLKKNHYTLEPNRLFEFYLTRGGRVESESTDLKPFVPPVSTVYNSGYGYINDNEDVEDWPNYLGDGAQEKAGAHQASQTFDRSFGAAMDVIPNEATWKLRFEQTPCVICGCDMATEHKTALLVDSETIACDDCAQMCEYNHVHLT